MSFYPSISDFSSQGVLFNDYTNVTVTEAHDIIENTTNLFILDVRTQEEYSAGHIVNAMLIPHDELSSRQNELPGNKSQLQLVYCRSGSRSVIASNILLDLNFTMVYNMLEGFNAWKSAGYPYEGSFNDPTSVLMQILIVLTIFGISMVISVVIIRELIIRKNNSQ